MGDPGAGAEAGGSAGSKSFGAGASLVGFRSWRIGQEGYLYGLYKQRRWRPGETMTAVCLCTEYQWGGARKEEHPDPPSNDSAGCGLYAYDQLATAEFWLGDQSGLAKGELIFGVVLLWGRVRVGQVVDRRDRLAEPGYRLRAQHARLVALDRKHPELGRVLGTERVALVARSYLEPWAIEYAGSRFRLEERGR